MKLTRTSMTALAALAIMVSASAHAGPVLQGWSLNGQLLQGVNLNGPGLVLQGVQFNGPGVVFQGVQLNGPGIVIQGCAFNGVQFNGPGIVIQGTQLFAAHAGALVLDLQACKAPAFVGHSAMSGIAAAQVNVRLANR